MNGDDGLDVRGVAAAHDDDNRDVAVAARVEHQTIAGAQVAARIRPPSRRARPEKFFAAPGTQANTIRALMHITC